MEKRMNKVARRSVAYILLQTKLCLTVCAADVRAGRTKAALAAIRAVRGNARQAEECLRMVAKQKRGG